MMQKREYAVSPVVGVMLMLVVTIIIAAVVAAFASGAVGQTSKTPQATISATFTAPSNGGNQSVFTNNGGDPFDLNDIRVVLQDESAGGGAPTKTTLTLADNATSNCILFQKVGDTTSTVIRAGDSFVIVGKGLNYGAPYIGIGYGHFAAMENDKITWSIVDKASGGTISTGTQIL